MSIRPLPPALAEKARLELNEDPKRVQNDLQSINDQWLVTFLRGCKYSLERTKEKLDLFYSLRTLAPDMFHIKHSDPKFDEILSLGVVLILPKVAGPDAPRVGLVRTGAYDPTKYKFLDIMSVANTIMRIIFLEDDHATIAGTQNILDLEDMTMAHMLQMTPVTTKKMISLGQDASPLRMKGNHYLNTPPGFETVFNLVKGMLNEKNRSRLFVHNKNVDAMYKHVPKEILPKEYGGDGGTIPEIVEHWRNKVKEYSSWLDEDEKYRSDESKRPGKPRSSEDMFGVEGSFRQLEFD